MNTYRLAFNNSICTFHMRIEIMSHDYWKLQELGNSIARQLGATFYYSELVEG